MPHLLRVKPEHASKFGGLFPFGPFNRIVFEPVGIYLESGFLDLVLKGFFNYESYTPAMIDIKKDLTPIVGLMTFQFRKLDASIFGLENLCGFEEVKTVQNVCSTEQRESKALNCATKTNEITMIDPRGEGKECSVIYFPKIPAPKTYDIGTSLGNQMDYVNSLAINGGNTLEDNFISSGFRDACIDRAAVEKKYAGEFKIFCPNDILYRKFCQRIFPPSLFSGKLKLYIQSIYGGNYVGYSNEQDGAVSNLKIGPMTTVERVTAKRTVTFGRGSHILHTDSLGNYYLINTYSWTINPLVPNFQGILLKRYLRSLNLPEGKTKDAYEAYILTTCVPTRICSAISRPDHTHGSPLDFGWKANWQGTTLAQVAHKSNERNYRVSTLLSVNVSSSGTESLYEDEINRKKANLILQQERKRSDYVQIPGIYPVYSCSAKIITSEIAPGIFDHCFDGDIEDGLWFYDVLGYTQASSPELLLQVKEEALEKNKLWGGLPYSELFFDELPSYFDFSLSEGVSHVWIEPLQIDKIFVWDSFFKDYSWNLNCNPLYQREVRCPDSGSLGTFPVYCWFDRKDVLQVVNYISRAVNGSDWNTVPPEGLCGPGTDSSLHEEFNGGIISGFGTEAVSLTSMTGTSTVRQEWNMTVTAGEWDTCWGGGCGPEGGCDNDVGDIQVGGVPGCYGTFFTSWIKYQHGSGESVTKNLTGMVSHYSCLIIPSDDAEGVYLGIVTTRTENGFTKTDIYNRSLVVAVQESGVVNGFDVVKKATPAAQGWFPCGVLWFAKVWGTAPGCAPGTPDWVGDCWAGFWIGNPPVDVPARQWGPYGKDTPVVVSKVAPSGLLTSTKTVPTFTGHAEFKSCFIGKDGRKVAVKELERVLTDPEDLFVSGVGFFYEFLEEIDLHWTYAQTGDIIGSLQTVQNLKKLRHPFGITTDPKEFPYAPNYTKPVGYI